MTSDLAISVRNLGKSYTIAHNATKHITLAEAMLHRLRHPFARARSETFHALSDVAFDVKKGDVVGIIGRNGAGKSTLLKVLSRITEPTTGQIDLYGRVGSLLEVGTGFHPELTGRENIYLNGHILGMRKKEIDRQFDAIVDFAGVEQFLDTPVKRYSSGMYVRLAFAVAAHLDSEILVVDEVLAVGDSEFQKKCLGKMKDVASSGRTVLLVSHNADVIRAMCSRAIFLASGRLVEVGPAGAVIDHYAAEANDHGAVVHVRTPRLRWEGLRNRQQLSCVAADDNLAFELGFSTGRYAVADLHVDIALNNERGEMAVHCKSKFVTDGFDTGPNTKFALRYCLQSPMLAPGRYFLTVYAYSGGDVLAWVEQVDACVVSARATFGRACVFDGIRGSIVPRFEVTVADEESHALQKS